MFGEKKNPPRFKYISFLPTMNLFSQVQGSLCQTKQTLYLLRSLHFYCYKNVTRLITKELIKSKIQKVRLQLLVCQLPDMPSVKLLKKKSITKNISIVSPSIKYLRSLSFLNTRNLRRLKAGAVVKKI